MRTVDDSLSKRPSGSPPQSQRELRDRLAESLAEERPDAEGPEERPYASLLRSAGSAHSLAPHVARNKNKHVAEIYAPKGNDR